MKTLGVITPWSMESIASSLVGDAKTLQGTASATYPAANRALYIPFTLSEPFLVTQLFAYNGATVGNNNIDVGIYDRVGIKIISSGSTLTSGANALQLFNVTDTLLGAGKFFLAVAMDGTTDTLFRTVIGVNQINGYGCSQQATAFALPATATFAAWASTFFPIIGATNRTTI